MKENFLGLNNFVWWFGVVENREDPLQLGRCQVRCFGWHSSDINQVPTTTLPWAQPVVPYGAKAIQPPAEGTMVFGFFADGENGHHPIMLGTVPGIPEEIRQNNMGFADPFTDEEKASGQFPRKIANSTISVNGAGPTIVNDTPKRNPSVLNEPTTSRLARPERVVEANTNVYLGIRSESIANTAVDFQRKNRAVSIKNADNKFWQEPFPSFNAKYPYNNVTETESGHAFELDDTPDFERVQLSHRTGSTLEFLPSGSIKFKSFNNKFDIVMGNEKTYINGVKDETVQSDMLLRINGNLIIKAENIDFVANSGINIQGATVKITALNDLHIASKGGDAKLTAAGDLDLKAKGDFVAGGLKSAALVSQGDAKVEAGPNKSASLSGTFAKISGLTCDIAAVVTDIGSNNTPSEARSPVSATPAKKVAPKLKRVQSANKKEKTDDYGYREQQKASINNI
jgi:hypothetical protein